MAQINYLIPIPPVVVGGFTILRQYQWTRFQFSKDIGIALLNGYVHFYASDGQGGYGAEINQSPFLPIERNVQTVTGRDFINSSNGAYCSKETTQDSSGNPVDTYKEKISGNMVDPSLIIGQFEYFENLLASGVNITQLIPLVVADLAARGVLD